MEGSAGEPLLNADGRPPGGRACGSFGLSHGSGIEPFEPKMATLVSALVPSLHRVLFHDEPVPPSTRIATINGAPLDSVGQ